MLGNYPIVIDGQETGTLTVSRDGLMTVFDARCTDPGSLLRLSVYGEKEAYLGVMTPDGSGDVYLHKRLSRAALAGFPETIHFAGPAGLEGTAEETPESEREKETIREETSGPQPGSAEPAGHAAIQWRHGAGGALIGTREDARYLAIPVKAGVVPVGGDFERQTIADAEYAVFEIKNGNIN